jgi:tetratricopeptide (TPR) repeat protein
VNTFHCRWPEADEAFRQALLLAPGDAEAVNQYAQFLATAGQLEPALTQIEQAQELDPLSPIISVIHAGTLLSLRRDKEAAAQIKSVLAAHPDFPPARAVSSALYIGETMYPEAEREMRARVADLKVISRTSTQKYKSAPDNLREIAKQLGVAHIVERSVQKWADQIRVNVQLINAETDAHLWAESYHRKLTDIFAVESEIAKTIADTLQAKLTGAEKQMMAAQPTSDMIAYELYHKGRSLWERRSGDNIPRAISFYEQAIAHDPNSQRLKCTGAV